MLPNKTDSPKPDSDISPQVRCVSIIGLTQNQVMQTPKGFVVYDDTIAAQAESPMPGDCPVFPADNPWNTDISDYPVDPNSDDYIASIN